MSFLKNKIVAYDENRIEPKYYLGSLFQDAKMIGQASGNLKFRNLDDLMESVHKLVEKINAEKDFNMIDSGFYKYHHTEFLRFLKLVDECYEEYLTDKQNLKEVVIKVHPWSDYLQFFSDHAAMVIETMMLSGQTIIVKTKALEKAFADANLMVFDKYKGPIHFYSLIESADDGILIKSHNGYTSKKSFVQGDECLAHNFSICIRRDTLLGTPSSPGLLNILDAEWIHLYFNPVFHNVLIIEENNGKYNHYNLASFPAEEFPSMDDTLFTDTKLVATFKPVDAVKANGMSLHNAVSFANKIGGYDGMVYLQFKSEDKTCRITSYLGGLIYTVYIDGCEFTDSALFRIGYDEFKSVIRSIDKKEPFELQINEVSNKLIFVQGENISDIYFEKSSSGIQLPDIQIEPLAQGDIDQKALSRIVDSITTGKNKHSLILEFSITSDLNNDHLVIGNFTQSGSKEDEIIKYEDVFNIPVIGLFGLVPYSSQFQIKHQHAKDFNKALEALGKSGTSILAIGQSDRVQNNKPSDKFLLGIFKDFVEIYVAIDEVETEAHRRLNNYTTVKQMQEKYWNVAEKISKIPLEYFAYPLTQTVFEYVYPESKQDDILRQRIEDNLFGISPLWLTACATHYHELIDWFKINAELHSSWVNESGYGLAEIASRTPIQPLSVKMENEYPVRDAYGTGYESGWDYLIQDEYSIYDTMSLNEVAYNPYWLDWASRKLSVSKRNKLERQRRTFRLPKTYSKKPMEKVLMDFWYDFKVTDAGDNYIIEAPSDYQVIDTHSEYAVKKEYGIEYHDERILYTETGTLVLHYKKNKYGYQKRLR